MVGDMVDYRNLGTFFPENREILAEPISARYQFDAEFLNNPERQFID